MADRPKRAELMLGRNPFLRATVGNTEQALASAFGIKVGFSLDQRGRGALSVRFRPQAEVDAAIKKRTIKESLLSSEARRASLPPALFTATSDTPCVRVGPELLISEVWAAGLQSPVTPTQLPRLVSASQTLFNVLSQVVLETAPMPVEILDPSINRYYSDQFLAEVRNIASGNPVHEVRFRQLIRGLEVKLSDPESLKLLAIGARIVLKHAGQTVTDQFRNEDLVATGLLIQEAGDHFVELMSHQFPQFRTFWEPKPYLRIRAEHNKRAHHTINALLAGNPGATVFGLYVSSTLGRANAVLTGRALAAKIAHEEEKNRPVKLTSLAELAGVFGLDPINQPGLVEEAPDYSGYQTDQTQGDWNGEFMDVDGDMEYEEQLPRGNEGSMPRRRALE